MNPIKKTKFSPGYFDELEKNFMRIHNIAMGYEPRDVNSNEPDIIALANAQFPVPSHIHSTFQDWIRVQRQAQFDCFQEPSIDCKRYKCVTHLEGVNKDLDYFETVFAEKTEQEFKGPDPMQQVKPNCILDEKSRATCMPKANSDLQLVARNVAHFYAGLPDYEGEHPSTPVCSVVMFDFPSTDNGKMAAQQYWIRMQQMTPTRLCF